MDEHDKFMWSYGCQIKGPGELWISQHLDKVMSFYSFVNDVIYENDINYIKTDRNTFKLFLDIPGVDIQHDAHCRLVGTATGTDVYVNEMCHEDTMYFFPNNKTKNIIRCEVRDNPHTLYRINQNKDLLVASQLIKLIQESKISAERLIEILKDESDI